MLGFIDQGHDIILMIDANEGCGAGFAIDRLISVCGLVDAHTLFATQDGAPPPTYQRGSKKIDFILITPRVATAVKSVGILPLHDWYLSDHRALMLDLNSLGFSSHRQRHR